MLLDAKKRRYLLNLVDAGEFHTHAGFVPHMEIIGKFAEVLEVDPAEFFKGPVKKARKG